MLVAAGLAVWLADWFNEIVNALVLQSSDRAALWTATGPTAYQILIGLNVEIMFMFALGGIVYVKLLPADRSVRILGMPNRLAVALGLSLISVAVELVPARQGHVPLGVLVVEHAVRATDRHLGYLWFFLYAAWVYDAPQLAGSLDASRRARRDRPGDGARVRGRLGWL